MTGPTLPRVRELEIDLHERGGHADSRDEISLTEARNLRDRRSATQSGTEAGPVPCRPCRSTPNSPPLLDATPPFDPDAAPVDADRRVPRHGMKQGILALGPSPEVVDPVVDTTIPGPGGALPLRIYTPAHDAAASASPCSSTAAAS